MTNFLDRVVYHWFEYIGLVVTSVLLALAILLDAMKFPLMALTLLFSTALFVGVFLAYMDIMSDTRIQRGGGTFDKKTKKSIIEGIKWCPSIRTFYVSSEANQLMTECPTNVQIRLGGKWMKFRFTRFEDRCSYVRVEDK